MARPKWEPTAQDLKNAERLAARGLSMDQIALSLGIVPSTLYKKKKLHREFTEAIERGRATGIAQVANALFQNATGFTHPDSGQYFPPDTKAQVAFLSRRDPENWSERRQLELTGAGGGPVRVLHTPEQAADIMKNMLPEYEGEHEELQQKGGGADADDHGE
ncbi:hypothetical protein LLG95_05420 [bacterium]|nr:hypothetical protein [bacterium]